MISCTIDSLVVRNVMVISFCVLWHIGCTDLLQTRFIPNQKTRDCYLQLPFRIMDVCSECNETNSRGTSYSISCLECVAVFHLACLNVGISKKNFEKLKKYQTDLTYVKCKISSGYVEAFTDCTVLNNTYQSLDWWYEDRNLKESWTDCHTGG